MIVDIEVKVSTTTTLLCRACSGTVNKICFPLLPIVPGKGGISSMEMTMELVVPLGI